jgi:L-ascorbate metabolism protein UlaG (beta-lactamase superfamily)
MRISAALSAFVIASVATLQGQTRPPRPAPVFDGTDPGCQDARLVSTGGTAPRNPRTLALRWTGYSNFELAYGGQVILLDAYFDRGSMFPPLGFTAADVSKADVMLIGHAHYDHASDAATVAIKTGAVVVGTHITTKLLAAQSVNPQRMRTVTGRGGELLKFTGFTVEPILARHGDAPLEIIAMMDKAVQSMVPPPTAAQLAERAAIAARGVSGPLVAAEGTVNYLITFDSGFRIMYRDANGDEFTEFEKAASARIGPVDLAMTATAPYPTSTIVERGVKHVEMYQPRTYIPAHHDAPYNSLWRPTAPLFQGIKDAHPEIVTVSKGYREPICFVTGGAPSPRQP